MSPDPFTSVPIPRRPAPDGPTLLARLRTQAGLSQNQLARLANVNPAYINRIERRLKGHTPSREVVLRMASALELDLETGDRLLYAFGFAGRVDWQSAWTQATAQIPHEIARGAEHVLAGVLDLAIATAEPLNGQEPLP